MNKPPALPELSDRLTDKQRVFVEEYLTCWNATEAARRAGYSGNDNVLGVTGYDNLRNPKIAEFVKQRIAEKAMEADEVLARLADQARGNIDDFISLTGRGFRFDFMKARKAGKLHLLKSVSKGKQGTKIELYDAHAALVDIGRHLKLFTDNVDLTSGGEKLKNLTDERYDRAISTLADAIRDCLPGASGKQEGAMGSTEQTPVAGLSQPGG